MAINRPQAPQGNSDEGAFLTSLSTLAGLFSAGVMAYERYAPTLQSRFLHASTRARYFSENYARANLLSGIGGLFKTEATLARSVGFGRLKIAAMVAGFFAMAHGALTAHKRLINDSSENRTQDQFYQWSGIFGGGTIVASAIFSRVPGFQFLTMIAGMTIDAAGIGISGADLTQRERLDMAGVGNFALQATITYLFGWDKKTRQALSAAANQFLSGQYGPSLATAMVGGKSASVPRIERSDPTPPHTFLTEGAGSVAAGTEGLPPEIVRIVMQEGGGDFSRPRHAFETDKNLRTETVVSLRAAFEAQLHLNTADGPVRLIDMPRAAVKARSPKFLTGHDFGAWEAGFRQVYDPRIGGTVAISTPGQVLRPRGVVILLHGGSTIRSTPQSLIEAAGWYHEQGFQVVIPSQPFHEYGPATADFDNLDHKMQWFRRIIDCAGDYFPEFRDQIGLAGRSLGGNDVLEYAVRYGKGADRDQRIKFIHAMSPYAPAWSDTCFDILGELHAAGLTPRNEAGAKNIQMLDDQWTFCRPKAGKPEVHPFPGGSRETRFGAAEYHEITTRFSEGGDLVAREIAALDAEIARVELFEPKITGPRRDELLALKEDSLKVLRKTRRDLTGPEGVHAREMKRQRYLVRLELARQRHGYEIEAAWADPSQSIPIQNDIAWNPAFGDPSPTALADVEVPVWITGGRLDSEYMSATPRHVEYWRMVAGDNRHVEVTEYPFGYHNPWETEGEFSVATADVYRRGLRAHLDRTMPLAPLDVPMDYRMDLVLRHQHQISPEIPSDRILAEMVARRENVEWAAIQPSRQRSIADDIIRGRRNFRHDDAIAKRIGIRDVETWSDQLLSHGNKLLNTEDREVAAEVTRLLGISERPSWGDEKVQEWIKDLRRHLCLEAVDRRIPKPGKAAGEMVDEPDRFIRALIDRGVSKLSEDPAIQPKMSDLEVLGLDLNAPPTEGEVGTDLMAKLLALTPTTLLEERLGLKLKWPVKKP
ncbi:MAG: hypothetical protein HYT76_08860 [Deltaproteobacteria bacterium]|nr:hypothetical protein [Deltaproteobacteria bacterium]